MVVFYFYCNTVFSPNVQQNSLVVLPVSSFPKTTTVHGFGLVHFITHGFPWFLMEIFRQVNNFSKRVWFPLNYVCPVKYKVIRMNAWFTYRVPNVWSFLFTNNANIWEHVFIRSVKWLVFRRCTRLPPFRFGWFGFCAFFIAFVIFDYVVLLCSFDFRNVGDQIITLLMKEIFPTIFKAFIFRTNL